MNSVLTVRERVFIQKFIELKNGTAAALAAYDVKGKDRRKIASVMSTQILKRHRVMEALKDFISDEDLLLILRLGLSATKIQSHLGKHTIRVPDWTVRMRCIELAFRAKNALQMSDEPETVRYPPKVKFVVNKVKSL
jgi:hypothetical protein